jgi:hypothetical protein
MTASAAAPCYPSRRLSTHYNGISFPEFQRFPQLGLVKPEIRYEKGGGLLKDGDVAQVIS